VDHFRPKGRALDEDKTEHEGYDWLAFDWTNYRIAGSYPNSPHKDSNELVRGKWDFFPLAPGSIRASWNNRDCAHEVCLILDPANRNDPKLMTFDEKGTPIPSNPDNALARRKVEVTTHFLYLDSPRLISARKRKWRAIMDWIEEYRDSLPEHFHECTVQDFKRSERMIERIGRLSGAASSYAATARACLRANGMGTFIQTPEDGLVE
jgi:hypothetical protein